MVSCQLDFFNAGQAQIIHFLLESCPVVRSQLTGAVDELRNARHLCIVHPTLINKGYVYIAESPLYEITTKDRTYFAYTEPEKAAFLEKIGDKKYTIQRSKGLGENDPEMMWLTTMNPESRRLIKVMPTDVVQTAQVFDILLGDNLAGRKEHIAQHGAEYLDDLDVS